MSKWKELYEAELEHCHKIRQAAKALIDAERDFGDTDDAKTEYNELFNKLAEALGEEKVFDWDDDTDELYEGIYTRYQAEQLRGRDDV